MFVIDKIEILDNGSIQVRELEMKELAGGGFINGDFKRYCLTPDIDINSIENERLKAYAVLTWTPEIVSSYKESLIDG